MDKAKYEAMVAAQIKRVCPNDVGGQMVLAAFAQDSIDREFPKKVKDQCSNVEE